jgi:hypothetical protein
MLASPHAPNDHGLQFPSSKRRRGPNCHRNSHAKCHLDIGNSIRKLAMCNHALGKSRTAQRTYVGVC